KRHDLLIHAFRQVHDRRPDARLHLVGDGPLRKNLEQERDASGLREAVVFHGAQPRHELPQWFRHSAVTVVASCHEGQCLAAVEAAACGCPVVGFPIGILPELGAGSRIVRETNESALAGAILELLAQDAARRAAGASARRAAEDLFELRSSVERIRRIYAEALSRREADAPRAAIASR
ncbi:MAG: glycosyltransferase family 4 protein, partial [Acidobacteria bacterium]|nr:glycosyltransferase family 4 protein [Acidobacteriota bacterium]